MNNFEFKDIRKKLNKTQKQMAQLLGVSLKAVHSYEQGWRVIPPAVERHLYFLVSRSGSGTSRKPCWTFKGCPPARKAQCPAFEFGSGDICWFVNGTICDGEVQSTWEDKMKICRNCEVFISRVLG